MLKKYLRITVMLVIMMLMINTAEFIFKELIWEFFDDVIKECTIDKDDYTYLVAGTLIDISLLRSIYMIGRNLFARKEKRES